MAGLDFLLRLVGLLVRYRISRNRVDYYGGWEMLRRVQGSMVGKVTIYTNFRGSFGWALPIKQS